MGDQLVASTNSGCLCQLKIQSSLLLHTINSAHTVDGLPIIVTRTALKGAGIPDAELVFLKTFPDSCSFFMKTCSFVHMCLIGGWKGVGEWCVSSDGLVTCPVCVPATSPCDETPAALVSLIWDEQWMTGHECCV